MRFPPVLLLVLALAAFPAAANELVVLEAKGVDLAPGAKVDGTKVLKLAPGQRVTLISDDGRTVKLKGPFEEAPAPAAGQVASMGDALKNLMNQRGSGVAQLGVVRAAGDAPELPEPWIVDVGRSGARCLQAGAEPVLWGPKFADATEMSIEPTDRSWRAKGSWPAAVDRLALPRRIPLVDGGSYIVGVGGNKAAVTIHRMPASLADPLVQTAWMIEKGCEEQARALARQAAR
ncbi:MAG: hypothetical protein GC202_10035 [Alphaproteobacteria bacterium]|nr:hypothetical protein [Alphaproteobacteria bacterium]